MTFNRNQNKSIVLLKCLRYIDRHINLKMGIISGLVTGSIVFIINYSHGFWPAFASFCKQFFFNLFMAGYNARTCEKLAKSIESNWFSIVSASLIPTLQAFITLFAIHYFGRTPEPMASTLWQAIANLLIFFAMALIYRDKIQVNNVFVYKISMVFRLRRLAKKKNLN